MFTPQELQDRLRQLRQPAFRAAQILRAIYKEGKSSYEEINVLPQQLRSQLGNRPILCFQVAKEVTSPRKDTTKTLFNLNDDKLIEGVLMRFRDGRNSVCVSSQVGCGLKCGFCATGTMGFIRNLTAEEIADQVLYFDQKLKKEATRVDHVVFMGMGEPFLNYDAVMEAIRLLNDKQLLAIAARHITVSTSGIIPGIQKFSCEPLQINLAVSLHAPIQVLREKIMPIAKGYKLPQLMTALREYIAKTHRRVSYEYVMLKDVNDSVEIAKKLAHLIRGQQCHVNLIPYNQTYLGFQNAGKTRIDRFKAVLDSCGISTTVRVSLGQDISAACGQLAVVGARVAPSKPAKPDLEPPPLARCARYYDEKGRPQSEMPEASW